MSKEQVVELPLLVLTGLTIKRKMTIAEDNSKINFEYDLFNQYTKSSMGVLDSEAAVTSSAFPAETYAWSITEIINNAAAKLMFRIWPDDKDRTSMAMVHAAAKGISPQFTLTALPPAHGEFMDGEVKVLWQRVINAGRMETGYSMGENVVIHQEDGKPDVEVSSGEFLTLRCNAEAKDILPPEEMYHAFK